MEIVRSTSDFEKLSDNSLYGSIPCMKKTNIYFKGKNNILYCEEGVSLLECELLFGGNNAIVYLSRNRFDYRINVHVYHNMIFYSGSNNYFNNVLNCICSEEKHVFIGKNCLFAKDISIKTADPHLIYDINFHNRLNNSKSVFIGDSVWVGQNVFLLKGCKIHSGSIIGAAAVVSNKNVKSNTLMAGNPARVIKEGVCWQGACVHHFTNELTEKFRTVQNDDKIFRYNREEYVSFDELDFKFSSIKDVVNRLDYLKNISHSKNRFAL